jgi:DNA-binding NtrC family response regulator
VLDTAERMRVLVADDDVLDRTYLASKVSAWNYQVETSANGQEAFRECLRYAPHVVISDTRMPEVDGLELTRRLRMLPTAPPVILLAGQVSLETVLSVIHEAGVFWCLEKTAPLDKLRTAIRKALQMRQTYGATSAGILAETAAAGEMAGKDPAILEVVRAIEQVAQTNASVLITGESGSGKEMAARMIHALSSRVAQPFVAVNCAAMPATLMETELFGHEAGAFTSAAARHIGHFEAANGGTLFLDEIGELTPPLQATLLRALETNSIRRVGGNSDIPLDVRVVAATNKGLTAALESGAFRRDLYYRLNVFHLQLPPLRERRADIPAIAEALMGQLARKHGRRPATIAESAMQRLLLYDWPGNVRELRNVLERALILADNRPVSVVDLPPAVLGPPMENAAEPGGPELRLAIGQSMEELEKRIIIETFGFTGGDRRRTASILGLSLKTIQTRLKRFRDELPLTMRRRSRR